MKKNSSERIIESAIKEFATHGYGGARMEQIAKNATINKAMLFYYFTSKKNLYQNVIQRSLGYLFFEIGKILHTDITPDEILERVPELYFDFFSRHSNIMKVIGLGLLQNPEILQDVLSQIILSSGHEKIVPKIWTQISRWYAQRKIRESEPRFFMMNIISLSLFSFIGLPIFELFAGKEFCQSEDFLDRRLQSVIQVLKKGMLP